MNYYERHLGDYARDAGHLPMIEHGAYTLLLDRYYTTEQPIPSDQVYRIARAVSKVERAAVDAVLREFFVSQDGFWHNRRADAEIEKAQTKIKAARENGKRGGRPKTNPDVTQQEPTGLILGSKTGTQIKAHQAPDTRQEQKNPPTPQVGGKGPQTFTAWVKSVPAGTDVIPPDHHVFTYADRVGIPRDFLDLAWVAFERRYAGAKKRYTDWPRVFRNAVEGNWGKVWFMRPDGGYELTTVGRQLQLDSRMAA